MSEPPQRPSTDDPHAWAAYRDAWRAYTTVWHTANPDSPSSDDAVPGWTEYYAAWSPHWAILDMPWRTEPEIDAERQAYLAERRAITPDIRRGIYLFRNEHGSIKLTRADVEWLLATHEGGGMQGPVDWSDLKQRGREGLDLRGGDLHSVDLHGLPMTRMCGGFLVAELPEATRDQRHMAAAHLEHANLRGAHLEGAELSRAHLEGADLTRARLEATDLFAAHLENLVLNEAYLAGSDLRRAFFDNATLLYRTVLYDVEYGGIVLAGVRWGGINLGAADWQHVRVLGDERRARQRRSRDGKVGAPRLPQFEDAVKANRQLATALRGQGVNEDADRFAYRAQMLQRIVFRRQRKIGRWAFLLLLDTLAGYGYKLGRILIAYFITLAVFGAAFYAFGLWQGPVLTWYQSLLVSLTAVHGRVFFEQFGLNSALSWVAAVESVVGIVIEGVFVAMLVQRFFAR
jgi:uncharacterized protein YjbI with pentapeptide repeats